MVSNNVINIKKPYGSAKEKAPTPEERRQILEQTESSKERVIAILGFFAGLRVGEIQQCRFSWLSKREFSGKKAIAIDIPEKDRDLFNMKRDWKPKTKRARTTYIFEYEYGLEVYEWLKHNSYGVQLTRQNISTVIVKRHFGSIIGRSNISIHALRSAAANYLYYEMMFPMHVIAILLGHQNVSTTAQHYDTKSKASAESYIEGYMRQREK